MLTLKKNNFPLRVLIYIILLPASMISVYLLTIWPPIIYFSVTNLIILSFAFIGMMLNYERPYSLVKMVYVFVFFFFGVVPLNDIYHSNVYWDAAQPVQESFMVITNILIILGVLSFFVGSHVKVNYFNFISVFFNPKISKNNYIFLFFFAFVAFTIFYMNSFDIYRLVFRGAISDLLGNSLVSFSQTERLILNNFIRPMPFILLAVFVYLCRSNKKNSSCVITNNCLSVRKLFLVLFIVLSIFLVAPTSVPRFQAAALYIPLILIFTTLWDWPYRMQFSILGALLVVMPFLDKFRRFDPESFSWSIDLNFLNHGHFDAYQNFSRVVEIGLITNGKQLMGSLLFFVPRAVWESKPNGSGATLADVAGYSFSNISMPFIAEGYINFGVVGVVIFMFILGLVLGNLDRIAWGIKKLKAESLFVYYYYFLFGMVFFVMRGDMMSSFAYTVGITVSFLFVVYALRLFNLRLKFRF